MRLSLPLLLSLFHCLCSLLSVIDFTADDSGERRIACVHTPLPPPLCSRVLFPRLLCSVLGTRALETTGIGKRTRRRRHSRGGCSKMISPRLSFDGNSKFLRLEFSNVRKDCCCRPPCFSSDSLNVRFPTKAPG